MSELDEARRRRARAVGDCCPLTRQGAPHDADCPNGPLSPDMTMEPWDSQFADLAKRMADVGGQPTHIAINPENVDAAIAAGLDVEYLPPDHPGVLRPVGPVGLPRFVGYDLALVDGEPVATPVVMPQQTYDRLERALNARPVTSPVIVPGPDPETEAALRGVPLDLAVRQSFGPELSLEHIGPATRADLQDFDAVPEPVDSAAPAATYLPGAAPIGPDAETRPIRRPR